MRQRVPLPPQNSECVVRPSDAVVVVGSGPLVFAVVHALRQHGIKPVCVCPLGDELEVPMDGIPVCTITEARAKYPDAIVFLLSAPRQYRITHAQLIQLGWRRVKDCAYELASFEYGEDSFPFGLGWLHFYLDSYFQEYFQTYHPDHLVLLSVDVVITERCSLKCRNCANLMQYYTDPKDANFSQLFSALDLLISCVDNVLEFRVLGGEPFMNRGAAKYLARLRKYDNYSRIAVFTNGTIVPKAEILHSLAHEDPIVRFSDYGPLSRRLNQMMDALDAAGVAYEVEALPGWQPCGTIARRNRNPTESTTIFLDCCARTIFTLLNGCLYQCPFAANACNLGALPRTKEEYVDLRRSATREAIRRQLLAMVNRKMAIPACDYCGGRRFGALTEPVAMQIAEPLTYMKIAQENGMGRK